MSFIPKDKKYPKIFKFRLKKEKSIEHRSIRLLYGNYGLKVLSHGFLLQNILKSYVYVLEEV